MSKDNVASITVNDIYNILSASLELQKKTMAFQEQTLACLQEMKIIQQQQIQIQQNNNSAKGKEESAVLRNELLKVLVADLQNNNSANQHETNTAHTILTGTHGSNNRPAESQKETDINHRLVTETEETYNSSEGPKGGKVRLQDVEEAKESKERVSDINYIYSQLQKAEMKKYNVKKERAPPKHLKVMLPKRLSVPCKDGHLRDIKKIENSSKISDKTKVITVIAQLLTEKSDQIVLPELTVVENTYQSVKKTVYDVHAHMMDHLAKVNDTSIDAIMDEVRFPLIPADIQDKYAFFIERNVLETCGLKIGRCQNMWAARILLQNATMNRSYYRHLKNQLRDIKIHLDECDGGCEVADNDLASMEGLPLSLIKGKKGSNSNHVEEEQEEVKRSKDIPEDVLEEIETEHHGSDTDYSYEDSGREEEFENAKKYKMKRRSKEKETIASSTIQRATTTRIPIVVAASDDDENENSSDGFYSQDENGNATASSSKRPNNDQLESHSKKKGKTDSPQYSCPQQ